MRSREVRALDGGEQLPLADAERASCRSAASPTPAPSRSRSSHESNSLTMVAVESPVRESTAVERGGRTSISMEGLHRGDEARPRPLRSALDGPHGVEGLRGEVDFAAIVPSPRVGRVWGGTRDVVRRDAPKSSRRARARRWLPTRSSTVSAVLPGCSRRPRPICWRKTVGESVGRSSTTRSIWARRCPR